MDRPAAWLVRLWFSAHHLNLSNRVWTARWLAIGPAAGRSVPCFSMLSWLQVIESGRLLPVKVKQPSRSLRCGKENLESHQLLSDLVTLITARVGSMAQLIYTSPRCSVLGCIFSANELPTNPWRVACVYIYISTSRATVPASGLVCRKVYLPCSPGTDHSSALETREYLVD